MLNENTIQPRTLYIVATPIGNLGDISQRALDILHQVDFILCEDTRHSSILLERFQIKKKLVSYFAHNEALRTDQFLPTLLEGQSAALITDAGTPGISDPGSRLVDACLENGIHVCPVPGACAVPTAVSACGFYQFTGFEFIAFFPRKSSERIELFESFKNRSTLLVGYESPQRIESLLVDLISVLGPDRRVCLCRELTKKYETIERCTAQSLIDRIREDDIKGEICLIVEGKADQESQVPKEIDESTQKLIEILRSKDISDRDIRDIVSDYTGIKPKVIYQYLIDKH